jgi:ferritin-like metal-binding protein YciE
MTMNDPRQLLIHELGDILFAEQTIVKMLPKVIDEVNDEYLTERLDAHLAETKSQVTNVEQAFKALGETPKAEKCPAILGLKQEHDDFVSEEKPSPDVLDLFNVGSASRVEHYEIAAYNAAISLAKTLGEEEVCTLLEKNLDQEMQMLLTAEKIGERLGGQFAGAASS